jgi:hypothetical protein
MSRPTGCKRIPGARRVDVADDSGRVRRLVVGLAMPALVSGCMGLAGLGPAAGPAHADPGPSAPMQWCPGQSLWISGNHVTNPVIWDNSVCHTYYVVDWGQGNVAQNIWDGPDPPAAIPPSPPPPWAITTIEQCEQILGMFCPHV